MGRMMGQPRFDPFTDTFRAEPRKAYDSYRGSKVHWGKSPGTRARGAWYVFDSEALRNVLTSDGFGRETHRACGTDQRLHATSFLHSVVDNWVMFRDPPVHAQLRSVLSAALRRERMELWRGDCAEIAQSLACDLDRRSVFDLVADYAVPFAANLIARIAGLPTDDSALLARTAMPISRMLDFHPVSEGQAGAARAVLSMRRYLENRWAQAGPSTGQALLPVFKDAVQRQAWSTRQAIDSLILLVATGQATLTNLVANSISCLLKHPEQLAALEAGHATAARVVEEVLRFESPVQFTSRVALDDIQLGRHRFNRNDLLICALGAASNDPSITSDAHTFRLDRDHVRHQAFGGGIHACLGANLARVAGSEAIRSMLPLLASRAAQWPSKPWRELALFRARTRVDLRLAGNGPGLVPVKGNSNQG